MTESQRISFADSRSLLPAWAAQAAAFEEMDARTRCRCVRAPQHSGCPLYTYNADGLCDPCRDRGCPPQYRDQND